MNKLIATIALAALAFTSCIKENDTWKEMLPVQPGMYIYQLATDQDKLAMRPANAALRLAMLLAEADKQGEDVLSADLKEIVVKKGDASIKVWETLFGAHTCNPAKSIECSQEIGTLAVGARADILLLDQDLNIVKIL